MLLFFMISSQIKIIFSVKAHSVPFALGPTKVPARVHLPTNLRSSSMSTLGIKMDRIRTDITDITFVFIFLSGFGFEYG